MKPEAVIIVVVFVGYFIGQEAIRRYFDSKLEGLFAIGRYDECIECLDRTLLRMLYSTYRQYYLRFTIYEAAGNEFAANKMLDHLLGMRASKARRLDLVLRAFSFYAQSGKRKQAKAMLEEIENTASARQAADSKMVFDIVFKRDVSHLAEMERLLERTKDPAQRGKLLFLLSKQYKTRGNTKRAAECEEELAQLKNAPVA